ncbi:hypothetical protein ASD83_06500 [Devosia sp. Root685]|uniref:hypothetical protein n=1 Tax=Devosia sp. Root685 TaxID=1736587 RepID=UPI000701EE28|nr:hypothetical protein [Devosia sp. Root685]KRB01170.1 hypothetical protein ASD83_06500 [Devosia sp. Root685]
MVIRMTTQFELRRKSDELVYSFAKKDRPDGLQGFQRTDRDLWIIFKERLGWVAWDDENQTVTGRPWNILPEDQSTDLPPQGEWVSLKGTKSYVYELVHVTQSIL